MKFNSLKKVVSISLGINVIIFHAAFCSSIRAEDNTSQSKRRALETTQKRAVESTQKRAVESTQKRAAESTQKRAAESTQKRAAESIQKRAHESTQKRAHESTQKRAHESTQKTEDLSKSVPQSDLSEAELPSESQPKLNPSAEGGQSADGMASAKCGNMQCGSEYQQCIESFYVTENSGEYPKCRPSTGQPTDSEKIPGTVPAHAGSLPGVNPHQQNSSAASAGGL